MALFFEPDGGLNVGTILATSFALGIVYLWRRYEYILNRAVPFHWPAPEASFLNWSSITIRSPSITSHLLDPVLLPPNHVEGKKYITCYDPSNGLHITTVPADAELDIHIKIDAAKHAQEQWKTSSFRDRRRIVRSLLTWLVREREMCARIACRDTGKTLVDAALGEIMTTCSKMEWLLKHGEDAIKPATRHSNLLMAYKKSQVFYEPLGVVCAVVSWNYPLHNALSPILAAIFSGNAIVVKCSEYVAWSSTYIIGAVRECISACGWDPDIVQLVICYPEEAEALTTSPDIKHITFIGSETVGRKVMTAAAVNLTPVVLELGGKDPAIILPNTDLERWASTWMRGAFGASGQNCVGIERFIIHRSQHDEFINLMAARIRKLRLGSVLSSSEEGFVSVVDGGSMISDARFAELERLVKAAEHDGAQVVTGGERWTHAYLEEGAYFPPTLIGHVNENMEIAQTEVFAPIMLVIPYDDVQEAVAIANGSRYGLGASVFGRSQSEAVIVAHQLECGMVSINDFGVFYLNQDLPFGGVKGSGFGRFAGPEGLRGLCNTKVLVTDRWPWLVQTKIPAALDYPIRSLVTSWEFIGGLIAFAYGDSLKERLYGLYKLIRNS